MTWISVLEYARKHGITTQSVRGRMKRGTLKYRQGWKKMPIVEVLDSEVVKHNLASSINFKRK